MKLQTPVTDEKCKVGISYKDKIMMLGSCFSDNIGGRLADYGFDVCVNPFGTLYNPASIAAAVERLVSRVHFTDNDCVEIGAGSQRICSFSHHTSFSGVDSAEFLTKANDALEKAADFFLDCNKVIITLGTSWCFRHIATDKIVSNCLKHPAAEFQRERLSAEEVAGLLKQIMATDCGKEKEFIFTVSPIRHFKDGAHGNQLSKSALLLGIDELITTLSTERRIDYFPAYEIVMDELRDYRFYAEDMCHPTQQTVDYIRERFLDWSLPQAEHPILEESIRTFKRNSHIQKPH
jgi:hypothetical protein